jgi:hypothetical protein
MSRPAFAPPATPRFLVTGTGMTVKPPRRIRGNLEALATRLRDRLSDGEILARLAAWGEIRARLAAWGGRLPPEVEAILLGARGSTAGAELPVAGEGGPLGGSAAPFEAPAAPPSTPPAAPGTAAGPAP